MAERDEARRRVEMRVARRPQQVLIWRAYFGTNTAVVDGFSRLGRWGWHRIQVPPETPVVIVLRIAFVSHRWLPSDSPDPSARRRRLARESDDEETAAACKDIRDAHGPLTDVVVLVHGTMSCAMPWASVLRDRLENWSWFREDGELRESRPVLLRYEHDTWLPVGDNAKELAERLQELGVKRGVLIGHSRGGLVIRHASEIAQLGRPEIELHSATFGAPFKGTPYARVARGPLGAIALLGAIRLPDRRLALDPWTRLAALLVWVRLPRGIAAMNPSSDYLSAFAHRPPERTIAVAGEVESGGQGDRYTSASWRELLPPRSRKERRTTWLYRVTQPEAV